MLYGMTSKLATTLAFSLVLATGASLTAQDECITALPITVGGGPYTGDTSTATPSAEPWSCVNGLAPDVWYSFTATQSEIVTASLCNGTTYDSALSVYEGTCGALNEIQCLDDSCSLQSEITWTAFTGLTYYVRVGGFSSASSGTYSLDLTSNGPAFGFLIDAAKNQDPLSRDNGIFDLGDTIRWNLTDLDGAFPGYFTIVGLNLGTVGATTPQIANLDLAWQGSNPTGYSFILPPNQIGGGDYVFAPPAGAFPFCVGFRIQGLVLAPAEAPTIGNTLPVVATNNSITYTRSGPATVTTLEDFEAVANGTGSYPLGWSTAPGATAWTCDSGGTPSGGTGPSAGVNASLNYMYCETSGANGSANFVMDTRSYSAAECPNGVMTFQCSRIGDTMGSLDVLVSTDGGTNFTPLLNLTGPAAGEWNEHCVYAGVAASYIFRFDYTGGGSFTGDIAIDDFTTR